MLRYKFRKAADLQGGSTDLQGRGGGGGMPPPSHKCSLAHYKRSCDLPFIPLQAVLQTVPMICVGGIKKLFAYCEL